MNILGIKDARFIEETGTIIDLVLETDEGDLPFAYNPIDDAPATEYVREKMGTFPIAIYEPPPPPTLDELKAAKRAEIAAARWEAETAGIDVNGFTVRTDRESQALITGAALQAFVDPDYTCRWKTETGFIELDSLQIKGIAQAVRAHVQSCFDREADWVRQIKDAETPEELGGIVWAI